MTMKYYFNLLVGDVMKGFDGWLSQRARKTFTPIPSIKIDINNI
jgi:hypothetical protein